ncbi:DedA family protein [Luteitalea sp. TBR-22]|uniref:YqaA family protein n=1 Tax=Luteitalea sp. TBR-22 TaxID=2802971 RepID=UPI001AF47931|nr:VTT domain-containing protein [Luteitalea sp. TBR-22]BCS33267.1 DedA family protein [Luteitalea sp. TBR-22]
MSKVVATVQSFAVSLGAPGLFLVALLDSSALSLPQVPDLLLIWMVARHPSMWFVYALMTTLGSVLGCVSMYLLARKGGERVLRKMISADRMERGRVAFQKWGLLAVLVPSILPPPAPFKVFVLLAGVVQIPLWQFVTAIGLGRGFRYFFTALLARWYGEAAMAFLEAHMREISLGLALVLVVAAVGWILLRQRRTQHVGAV